MDFRLDDQQRDLQEAARRFARGELMDLARERLRKSVTEKLLGEK